VALRVGGWLVLEVADGKSGEVSALLGMLRFEGVSIDCDLAGRERIVSGRRA
jgi:methylase of polypeptide subunit release factors